MTFYFRTTELNKVGAKKEGNDTVNDIVNDTVNDTVKLTKRQEEILKLIENNKEITHMEMAKALSITTITAKRTTKALRELGILTRIGSDKSGYWEIT